MYIYLLHRYYLNHLSIISDDYQHHLGLNIVYHFIYHGISPHHAQVSLEQTH